MIIKDKLISKELVEVLKSTLTTHDQSEIWLQSGVSKPTLLKIIYGDAYLSDFSYEAAIHIVNYAISKRRLEINNAMNDVDFLTLQIPAERIQEVKTLKPHKYIKKR